MDSVRNNSSHDFQLDHFEPILRVDITEEIIARIKLLMARGALNPGSKLPPERQFAQMLGVGRPALRQALKALSTMGIIESRIGQGTFINRSTAGVLTAPMDFMRVLNGVSLAELFEVRRAVEVELSGFAAERAVEMEISAIGAAIDEQKSNLDNPELFLIADLKFHNAIAGAAHNVLFTAILQSLSNIMTETRRKLLMTEKDVSDSFNDHVNIFHQISRRDPSAARNAMLAHLIRVYETWERTHDFKDMTAAPVSR